jgi:hypothetical protein
MKGDNMKFARSLLLYLGFVGVSVGLISAHGFSSEDSNAMVVAVQASKGAMIRVPIDNQGRELLSEAQLRIVGEDLNKNEPSGLREVWNRGFDVSASHALDSSTSGDSSTRGLLWGWNAWRWANYGWYSPYYYSGYWPTYYYNGYTYGYGSPYYYHYYDPYNYGANSAWGYRYYYYPSAW